MPLVILSLMFMTYSPVCNCHRTTNSTLFQSRPFGQCTWPPATWGLGSTIFAGRQQPTFTVPSPIASPDLRPHQKTTNIGSSVDGEPPFLAKSRERRR